MTGAAHGAPRLSGSLEYSTHKTKEAEYRTGNATTGGTSSAKGRAQDPTSERTRYRVREEEDEEKDGALNKPLFILGTALRS